MLFQPGVYLYSVFRLHFVYLYFLEPDLAFGYGINGFVARMIR